MFGIQRICRWMKGLRAPPDVGLPEGDAHGFQEQVPRFRGVYLAHVISGFVVALGNGLKGLATVMERGLAEERDRRAVESDAFLRRSVPHR
jgi:hypothetical protein